ncbi:substrate-binding domain-containing protein [Rubrivivax sp. JA1026]|uniref:substrate-binding domain-containing protein n=1 Tax=Rubrivivax sp. JA1026 TaxID=2710888 RepID=UPI0013E96BCA|nr:substrate-binding domain-containing protein [Rubrivivax sp. JA1026]
MRAQGVHLHHALQSGRQHGGELGHPLFELLAAVQASGSIQRAAAALGGSYRQVWASLKRWESGLGRPLVVWTQGHPARLTPHAQALLAEERLLRARHAPQIAALRAELERLFEFAAGDETLRLELPAVPDPALALLREAAAERHGLNLVLQPCAGADAVHALAQGRTALAAFALPEGPGDEPVPAAAQALLASGRFTTLLALRRTLGLMAAPQALPGGVAAVVAAGLRRAGRPPGSSAELGWLRLCRAAGLVPPAPARVEPTHEAAATAVAQGLSDTAFGCETAAAAQGLAFRALAHDRLLLVAAAAPADAARETLDTVLADARWRQALSALPGVEPLPTTEAADS